MGSGPGDAVVCAHGPRAGVGLTPRFHSAKVAAIRRPRAPRGSLADAQVSIDWLRQAPGNAALVAATLVELTPAWSCALSAGGCF
ncbi:MAG: hypothetical protein ACJ0GY_09810 [Synechococcus sp.]